MDEIKKMPPAEINYGVWAEGLRYAGGMEKIKKSIEKKKPTAAGIKDEHGRVAEKPDIIRQTHIRLFRENMSKGEMNKQPDNLLQRERKEEKEQKTVVGKEIHNEIPETDDDKFERIGDQAVVLARKPIRRSSGGGPPQDNNVQYLMRLYMGAETGVYKTKNDVKVTVFKDLKSKQTYLTFLIPLNETESEEVSIFLNPEEPERANIFNRSIKKRRSDEEQ